MVADEKGTNTTLATFVSAGGLHVPPMIIFKASCIKNIWHKAAPSGYMVKCSESGYISADVFTDYREQFIEFLKERNLLENGEKHMILLDLHSSYVLNIKFMQMMKENNIEVCSFPPHCTHVLQPLGDIPYTVLMKSYQRELLTFNFDVAGSKMSKMQFFRVLIPAITDTLTSFSNTFSNRSLTCLCSFPSKKEPKAHMTDSGKTFHHNPSVDKPRRDASPSIYS